MRKYLLQFKPFLIFISTFFAAYILLTVAYRYYLNSFETNDIDGISNIVGRNVDQLMHLFNSDVNIFKSISNPCLEVWYNKKYTLRIVEGCNAVSVIILFISFVIAFSGKIKTTLIFILFGGLIIYVLNVIRIASLTILLFHFPEKEHILHGVLFPLIIYGLVFLLWIIWVNKFSKYAK
ncbi:exosortase family protein XrtF [Flavobacterium sp. ANB]|uniref:exosortase family protein XrtF n=1 Tax=unclassified Flavobacterium TaxID=196869 RepID=UPI0012B9EE58|nr:MULTISPECIES: exosortase family protein XrtF [unclassified Flavobacterium]MBF4514904.1 exosortase family protein XrtF [Flavobacterium sp. ANB]MTD68230.1 exosortase family protein XrtF [Flavobacterium sp. LC2016-13]